MVIHKARETFSVFFASGLFVLISSTALADITFSGSVEPESVVTGLVNGGGVWIGDTDNSGSLAITDGSHLLVDNVNGSGGISTLANSGQLLVSGATLEINARTALLVGGGGHFTFNSGSYALLNGSDTRNPSVFNRGRAMIVGFSDDTGFVTIDGPGTRVDMIRRFNIKSTGGGTGIGLGRVTISNGALVTQDSTDSSLITGFTVGATGRGELILQSGGTLLSQVPSMRLGNTSAPWGLGIMDLSGGSFMELTSAVWMGAGGGEAILNVSNSTFRVLADPAAPLPETGDLYTGILGSRSTINVSSALFEIEGQMFMATDGSASDSDVDFQFGSTAVIGEFLGVSHDGFTPNGHGRGHLTVCDSTLTVPTLRIGRNGTLAGGGEDGTANVIATIKVQGGTIAPGCSPGEMTVDGDVEVTEGELRIEIHNIDNYDILTVLGALDFADSTVVFEFGNGFGPSAGDQFDFLQAASLTGTDNLEFAFEGLQEGFEFSVEGNGLDLTFEALTDGTPDFVEPQIDIRPGELNEVDLDSNQLIPVAVLTTQDAPIFDATRVDPSSLAFGPDGAKADPKKIKLKDVDDDGDLDLRVWFRIPETGIACGDTAAGLSGTTWDATEFQASDTLIIADCD